MSISNLSRRALAAALLLVPSSAFADTLYPTPVTPLALTTAGYTQNFNTLASTAPSSVLPNGWQVFEGGTNADGTYGISNGSATAGNAYSYGATNSTDRALGGLGSGSLSPVRFGAFFTNGLGSAITGFDLSYVGEQWRAASSTDDSLTFEYSLNATSLGNGTWVRVSALDFFGPNTGTAGAVDGNLAANRTSLTGTISGLNIASGGTFAFRWTDADGTGADDGLAVDDFALTAVSGAVGAVPEPASWAMMIGGFAMMGVGLRRRTARVAIA